jgi:hypothetical protein
LKITILFLYILYFGSLNLEPRELFWKIVLNIRETVAGTGTAAKLCRQINGILNV